MEEVDNRVGASNWKQPTKGKVRVIHDNGQQKSKGQSTSSVLHKPMPLTS